MKRLFLLLLALPCIGVFAQNSDRASIQLNMKLEEAARKNAMLYMEYMETDMAKIPELLESWKSEMEMSEPIMRARILYELKNSTYSASVIPQELFKYVYVYNNRTDMIGMANMEVYDRLPIFYGFIKPGSDFDLYTVRLAGELKEILTPGSEEYFWADFYSGANKEIFSLAKEDKIPAKKVTEQYEHEVETHLNIGEMHMELAGGMWIPVGGLAAIGTHPEIGLQLGWKQKRLNYDATFAYKFSDSKEPFKVYQSNTGASGYYTNAFSGAYIGFDFGYDIWRKGKSELQLIGALGFDMFFTDMKGLNSRIGYSGYLGVGAAYRFYAGKNGYIGLKVKYNHVNYTHSRVIDYKGGVIVIQLTTGVLINPKRNKTLNILEYPYREW